MCFKSKQLLGIAVLGILLATTVNPGTVLAQTVEYKTELPPAIDTTNTPEPPPPTDQEPESEFIDPIDSAYFTIPDEMPEESEATIDSATGPTQSSEESVKIPPGNSASSIFNREFSDDYSLNAYFPDVPIENQYFIAIQFLKHNGMIQGYPDGTFKPDRDINRAEALKVLLEALPVEIDSSNENVEFPDINPKEWYYLYVVKAFNRGLVKGYPDGQFHPENTINQAEALKITLLHEEAELPTIIEEQPFPDVPVDAWFSAYAQLAKERTLILESLKDGNLTPENLMTRGEFCELIYRLIKSKEGYRYGRSSWYGENFAGRGTASGEKFDPQLFTAAHRTLPLGTYVKVTNTANGNEVTVKINDRGPYGKGKHLDLSEAAFAQLAPLGRGIINIQYHDVSELQKLINIENGF